MSLTTQTKLEELRGKLYVKAKTEPAFRFYALYDKIHRWDTLVEALKRSKSKRGAAGVDGQTFEDIEKYGGNGRAQELQRIAGEDLSASASAEGADTEAGRGRAAVGNTNHSRQSGPDGGETHSGTHL